MKCKLYIIIALMPAKNQLEFSIFNESASVENLF